MKKTILLSFALLLMATACKKDDPAVVAPVLTLEQQYENSVKDAMLAEANEVSNNLIAVEPSNTSLSWKQGPDGKPWVLVATWTRFPGSFKAGEITKINWGEMWVTTVPELKTWFSQNYKGGADPYLRAKQLLGLPAANQYTHFIEVWVNPDQLFRPAPDSEINDKTAGLAMPATVTDDFKKWFNDYIIYAYYPAKFPWTRLGYTYDWGSTTTEVGLSEFVVRKNADVLVKDLYETATYLK